MNRGNQDDITLYGFERQKYEKSYGYLCNLVWNHPDKKKPKDDIILEDAKREFEYLAEFQAISMKRNLKISFLAEYNRMWRAKSINCKKDRFERKYGKTFMRKMYKFIYPLLAPPIGRIINKGGRPRKNFEDLTPRAQQMRLQEIHSQENAPPPIRKLMERATKNQIFNCNVFC